MKLRVVLPLLLLLQARWQEIGKTRTGNPVYVDPKTVKKADGIVSASLRVVYVKPAKTPKGDITVVRSAAMFDCAKNAIAAKETTMYLDEKLGTIFQRSTNVKPGFGPAIEGSFGDVALKHFCAK
jgi:surface-adhesin protein E